MIIYHKKIIIRPPPPSSWTAKGQVGLLLGFTEFFSAAPDFYSILFCFTAFYWTCFGIYWDLLGFTGFYWVSCFFLFYIREIRVCQRNPPPSPPKKSAGERRRSANAAANGKKEAPPTAYLRPTPRPRLVSRTGGLRPSNAPKKKTTHRPLNKSSNRAGTPPSSFTFFCCLFLLKPKFLHDRPRVPISLPSVFSTFNPRFSINYHLLFFCQWNPNFFTTDPELRFHCHPFSQHSIIVSPSITGPKKKTSPPNDRRHSDSRTEEPEEKETSTTEGTPEVSISR